jgi:hypothetical protein
MDEQRALERRCETLVGWEREAQKASADRLIVGRWLRLLCP